MAIYWKFKRRRADPFVTGESWRKLDRAELGRLGLGTEASEAAMGPFQGSILTPTDAGYAAASKLSNPVFDPHPYCIFLCACESDVGIALGLTWSLPGLELPAIRSGGHCTAGFSAGPGVLIDVSALNEVTIDPVGLTATVGAGCDFGKLSPLLDQYGLHVPIGDCPEVCVAGYMMGGGYSFTSRTFGMGCDNVLEARLLLSDGQIVRANANENSDLYWAVCGGTGGNFGVLLSLKLQLRALGPIMGFSFAWPLGTAAQRQVAAQALATLQTSYLSTAPTEMTPQMIFVWQPDGSGGLVPTMLCRGTYVGSESDGLAAIAPIRDLPGVQFQYATMGPFSLINKMLLTEPYELPPFPDGVSAPCEDKQARYVAQNLTVAQWQSVLDWFVTAPDLYSAMCFEVAGGAINALPLETNAFIHRTAQFSAFLDVFWWPPETGEAQRQFLAGFTSLFETFWNGEVYQNYPNVDVPDYRANYWGRAFDALAAVKAKYDPQTLFNFPQAAVPYPSGPTAPTWPPAVVAALSQPIQPGR